MSTITVSATLRRRGPHPAGRRCKGHDKDGERCITLLCTWNGSDTCAAHGGWIEVAPDNHRGQRGYAGQLLDEVLSNA